MKCCEYAPGSLGPYSQQFIFFVTYKGPNRLECYSTLGWKGLLGCLTLVGIHQTFYDKFANTLKHGCLILTSLTSKGTSPLSKTYPIQNINHKNFIGGFVSTDPVLYSQYLSFFVTYRQAQWSMPHYTRTERLARDKHSSLLGWLTFAIYKIFYDKFTIILNSWVPYSSMFVFKRYLPFITNEPQSKY